MTTHDWDFKSQDTKTYTHGLHSYPAMMIPQIARKLIGEYGKKAEVLLDPYCGSGTSLVEANLHKINAVGVDINPLARLIASVKTTSIDLLTLKLYLKEYHDLIFRKKFQGDVQFEVEVPVFNNIDYWFPKYVQYDLSIIKSFIDKIKDFSISNFFRVAFSQTVRDCSYTRKNEYKLYRIEKAEMNKFAPDVYFTMENILAKNCKSLERYMSELSPGYKSLICDFNSIKSIPKKIVAAESIDLVLTSPPYGDSKTTVAYGEFSRLTHQWLNMHDCGNNLDRLLMGGIRGKKKKKFLSNVLNENIEQVFQVDPKRALDVVSFYSDYYKSIRNVSSTVKKGGYVCYVVSNRNVRGVILETDIITKDFFKTNGFDFVETYKRKIHNKRLPRKNSPNGEAGNKQELMNTESVVVLRKS